MAYDLVAYYVVLIGFCYGCVIYPRQNIAVCSGLLSTVGLLDCGIFFLAQCPLDCGVGLDYLFMCAHRNTSG